MARFTGPHYHTIPPAGSSPPPIHSLIATITDPINSQSSSYFFSIPYDIRLEIFYLALRQSDDETRPYPEHGFRSRPPPSAFRQRICTDLLTTCKRVYMEAHDIPLATNQHIFWDAYGEVFDEFGHPNMKKYLRDDLTWCFYKYTIEQRAAIMDVHLFVSKSWLKSSQFQMFCQLKDVLPKRLRITIRPTEWNAGINGLITLGCGWMDNLKFMGRLESFHLEMQTVEANSGRLETVAQKLVKNSIPLTESRNLGEATITRDRYMGRGSFEAGREWICAVMYSKKDNMWKIALPRRDPLYLIQYISTTLEWKIQ